MQDIHIRNNSSMTDAMAITRLGLLLAGQEITKQDSMLIAKRMYADGSIAYIINDNDNYGKTKDWRQAAEGLARAIEERNAKC